MDAEGEPREPGRPRERAGCAVGIALALFFLLASIAGLFAFGAFQRSDEIDGAARVAELFRDAGPPFGLQLAEAMRLQRGEVFLRLERPRDAADQESADEESADEESAGDEPGAEEPAHEAKPRGALVEPREVVLLEYRGMAAAAALFHSPAGDGSRGGRRRAEEEASRGASARLIEWEKDPSFAWHTTIERDEVQWNRWRAEMLVERSFREGGGWRDSARVNLSQPGRPLVLFAQWPDETPVDRGALERLVRSIRMLEPEAEDA